MSRPLVNSALTNSLHILLEITGKDVLAKARTGSGKTAAYAVPVIQKILADKEVRLRLPLAYLVLLLVELNSLD
jgi:superfamily II DNA/RNA helicase